MASEENSRADITTPEHHRSLVWKYFGFPSENGKITNRETVICRLCEARMKYHTTTSNMRTHLLTLHPGKLAELTSDTDEPQPKQARITSFMPASRGLSAERQRKITDKLTRFICKDMRPINISQGSGFKDFVQELEPRYAVPSRATISDRVVKLYDATKDNIKKMLSGENISLTTDGWTSIATEAYVSYVTVTAHFINEDWELKDIILKTAEVQKTHTAEHVAECIANILGEYNVRPQSVLSITTDNAANYINAVERHLQVANVPCMAHTINLAVRKGLTVRAIESPINRLKATALHFNKSTTDSYLLESKQRLLGVKPAKLINDCATRWNSTYDMVCRAADQQAPVAAVIMEKKLGHLELNTNEWSLMEQCPGALHSFHVQSLSLPHCSKGPGKKQLKEVMDYQRYILPPVTAQFSRHTSVLASILEQHIAELSAAQEWDNEWNSQGLLSRLTPQDYHCRKLTRMHKRIKEQLHSATLTSPESPLSGLCSTSDLSELLQAFRCSDPSDHVLTKGTHFTHTQKFTFTQEVAAMTSSIPTGHQSENDIQLCQQEELTLLQQQFHQLCSDVNQLAADIKHLSVPYTQVLDELKQNELGNSEKEEKIQVKKKTIDLLPDANSNLLKLQALVEASAKRIVNLASQWEKHRAPLIDELRRLKEICSNQDLESSRKLSEIKTLHDRIRVSTEEAKKKEEIYKQLVTDLENLPQDLSRSAYTQRILEIVSNIKKQKEEIKKILSDTKELQKEINNLTGKLDRTFAVTDELVFKDAKKDESVRKSYKYLAALHENCNQLIQTIEDTGTILREIRDLEEQIETENGNKTVANLERIMDDYKAIRQENSALAAKVRDC